MYYGTYIEVAWLGNLFFGWIALFVANWDHLRPKSFVRRAVPCVSCEKGSMHHAIKDVTYRTQKGALVVPAISGHFCDSCNEIIFDRGEGDRYARAISGRSDSPKHSHIVS